MNNSQTLIGVTAAVVLIAGCSKSNEGLEDVSMKCQGYVTYNLSFVKEKEMIATHINNGTITFSGNDYLRGNNIKFCPERTLDLAADTLYFDSSGCGDKKENPRQYGTYNKILKKLDLTNTHDGVVSSGRFECKKVE